MLPFHLQTTKALWPLQNWPEQGGLPDPSAVPGKRGTVLVVDDDVLLVKHVQACLADLADLQVALTADDALRLCLQNPPDLLLLDLQLGHDDGLRLLGTLRTQPALATLPVLVISASSDPALDVRAAGLAVRRWLDKPLEATQLREAVQSVLRPDRAAPALQPGHWLPTVLAIDDDPIALTALEAALTHDGLRLVTAADASGALARTEQWVPDVVLLDIGMPGTDGYQLARQLMAQPRMADVPVIFVTARGEIEAELRALSIGAFDFVSKPFVPEVLRARVGKMRCGCASAHCSSCSMPRHAGGVSAASNWRRSWRMPTTPSCRCNPMAMLCWPMPLQSRCWPRPANPWPARRCPTGCARPCPPRCWPASSAVPWGWR